MEDIARRVEPHMEKQARERNAVVSRWNAAHRPEFESRKIITGNGKGLSTFVALKNGQRKANKWGYTIGQIWNWYDKTGIKAHFIHARLAEALMFTLRRDSLPSPIGRARNFGAGDTLVVENTYHPGTQPAGTAQKITDRLRPETERVFEKAVAEAGARGLGAKISR